MNESFDAYIDRLVSGGFFLEEAVEILEKGMIERVLRQHENNQSEASKALGIHRNTLQRKMVAYSINGKNVRRKAPARAARNGARSKRKAS